jgi:hypothetical protein
MTWPYHANVMNTFEAMRSKTGDRPAGILIQQLLGSLITGSASSVNSNAPLKSQGLVNGRRLLPPAAALYPSAQRACFSRHFGPGPRI